MDKSLKWALGIAAGVGIFLYLKGEKYKKNKRIVITHLDAKFGVAPEHTTFVNSATKSYINAWADAIMKGQDTFVDPAKGTVHWTSGGAAKR